MHLSAYPRGEQRVQVKMYKKPRVRRFRSAFGRRAVQNAHSAVARSIRGSQNLKTRHCRNTFGSLDVGKDCAPLWREAHLEVKMPTTTCSDHLCSLICQKSACHFGSKSDLAESELNVRVTQQLHKRWCAWDVSRGSAKTHLGGRRNTRDLLTKDVRGQRADFLRKGAFSTIRS